ncbi:hypothetical protein N7541_010967 [Penicillium brevicompactum]|uniref:NAD(P)-binding domain-containing protein n=1 Tax=Penicillium brevicompactum TaxID=5074 RepID=A0A9W9QVH9_PENBR|nr:hypothetical protein N7541_010967 [Penicillium brevicompactum]
MRVLLLGATGNVGSRLLPALIQRGHVVTAMVRDPSRLPTGVQRNKFHVERGDASKATAIKTVAMEHECDAIVNAAGAAVVTQWGKSDLQTIVDAVIRAALEIGQERGELLRLWVFAGIGILDVSPKYMLVD